MQWKKYAKDEFELSSPNQQPNETHSWVLATDVFPEGDKGGYGQTVEQSLPFTSDSDLPKFHCGSDSVLVNYLLS